jgi:hypothetical protein
MFRQLRQLARTALTALALVAFLTATFGVHGHTTHDDHHAVMDHHEHDAGHGHDDAPPTGGDAGGDQGGVLFHAHGSAVQAGEPASVPTVVVGRDEIVADHPELLMRVPVGLPRDIDPPPNKHVL